MIKVTYLKNDKAEFEPRQPGSNIQAESCFLLDVFVCALVYVQGRGFIFV